MSNATKISQEDPSGAEMTLLQAGFELSAMASPSAICIFDGDNAVTYAELDKLANRIAVALLTRGVQPDDLIVLQLEKSARLLAMMLGVLKAGCAFAPIDSKTVREGLSFALKRAGAKLAITEGAGRSLYDSLEVLPAEEFLSALPESFGRPTCKAQSRNLAYAIFTSGSSGEPRLVGVEHKSIGNVINYSTQVLLSKDDLAFVPLLTSIGFDASVHRIFTTFRHGGTLLLERDILGLFRSERGQRITTLGLTPSMLSELIEAGPIPASVRAILLGGEAIPWELVRRLREEKLPRKVLNLYGPTETTCYSSYAWLMDPCRPEKQAALTNLSGRLIGHPIACTEIDLLDSAGAPVEDGLAGEIVISGAGVARGYLGDDALTAQRFGSFSCRPDDRYYRTGDLGRRLLDGSIEFLGRADRQIKIWGMRIEPAEIEKIICLHNVVKAVRVIYRAEEPEPKLVCYWIGASSDSPDPDLRMFLSDKLPSFMIPAAYVRMKEFPLSANGKIDSKEFPSPLLACATKAASSKKCRPYEQQFLRIWREILNRNDFGVEKSFFDLGGDSLKAVTLSLRIKESTGLEVVPTHIFNYPTIAELVDFLNSQGGQAAALGPIVARQSRGNKKPLYLVPGWGGAGTLPTGVSACFSDRQVYELRANQESASFSSVQEVASYYAAEILKRQPDGPFHLAGYSAGGWYAYALADELIRAGKTVGMLCLIDTKAIEPVSYALLRIASRLPKHATDLADARENLVRVLRLKLAGLRLHARRIAIRSSGAVTPELVSEQIGTGDHFVDLLPAYRPPRLPVHICLLCTRSTRWRLFRFYAKYGVTVHNMFDDHLDFLRPELSLDLGYKLNSILASFS